MYYTIGVLTNFDMEIIIYGIKEGFRVLYRTDGASLSWVYDARVENPDKASIGQSAYAVASVNDGFTFTKYLITKNLAYNGTETYATVGNVAFLLYLSKNEKMSGAEIHTLLDNLSEEFAVHYIHDGQMGKLTPDGKIEEEKENWDFVAHVIAPYESLVSQRTPEEAVAMSAGTQEPAYFYYTSNNQLEYCMEQHWPYYQHYRQVFFVSSDLKDLPSNPLRSLRHDNTQNLTPTSPTPNDEAGTPTKTTENPSIIENESAKPEVVKLPVNKKNEVTLSLTVVDEMGNAVPEVSLVRISEQGETEMTFRSGMISFEGAEMEDLWMVMTANGNMISDTFKPSDYTDQVLPSVVLRLHKRKVVTFKVIDAKKSNTELENVTIRITYNGNTEVLEGNQRIFEADELKRHFQLSIACDGYAEQFSLFSPETCNDIFVVKMEKEIQPGKTKGSSTENPFTGGGYVKTNPKIGLKILVSFLLVAVIGGIVALSIFFFGNRESKIPPYISSERVQLYLNDNSLNINILSIYLDSCKDAETILLTEATPETKQQAQKYVDLQEQLDCAITWRNAVDGGDIALAQNNYFPQDSSLYFVLKSINHSEIEDISGALKDPAAHTSDLTIPQVGTFIINVSKFLEIKRIYEQVSKDSTTADSTYKRLLQRIDNLQLSDLALVSNVRTPICQRLGISVESARPVEQTPAATPAVPTTQPTKPTSQPRTETEQFQADFWNLVHSGSNDFEAYKDLRNKAKKLKTVSIDNCPELNYLHSMTENMKNPIWQRFKTLTPAQKKKAQKIEEL